MCIGRQLSYERGDKCNQSLPAVEKVTISRTQKSFTNQEFKKKKKTKKMVRQVIWWLTILFVINLAHSKQMQNIDAIAQTYLTAEKYLWQLIYSTDRYNRLETFAYIYDVHEEHLGKNFGETGRFERLARLYQSRHSKYRETRSGTLKVIDAIEEINATSLNMYRILSHRTYDNIPHLIEDIGENVPRKMASICKHIDSEFWMVAKNVSIFKIRMNIEVCI